MRTFYRAAMRHGAPILFVVSLLIIVMSITEVYQTLQQTEALQGIRVSDFDVLTRFRLLFTAVAKSLLLAALPFGGAILVERIDRLLAQREPRA